jgi:hypothetical protein
MPGIIDSIINFARAPFDAADDSAQFQAEAKMSGAAPPGSSGEEGAEDRMDAARHSMWNARMRQRMRDASGSDELARVATDAVSGAHEYVGKAQRGIGKLLGKAQHPDAGEASDDMDFNNNAVGNAVGGATSTYEQAKQAILRELRQSQLSPSGVPAGAPGLVHRR